MVLLALVSACSTGPAASPATIARGAEIHASSCQSCHGDAQGKGNQPHVPTNAANGHTWQHSDADLEYIVNHGSDELVVKMRQLQGIPSNAPLMPAFRDKLSQDDIRAVIAYIKTLWSDDQRRYQQNMKSFSKSTPQAGQ